MEKRKNKEPKAKLISEFSKNSLETIRVSFTEFNGQKLLDVRVWVVRDGTEPIPTKKGISFRLDLIECLAEAINKTMKEVEREKTKQESCQKQG